MRWISRLGTVLASVMLLALSTACGVPQVISPELPASAGAVSVGKSVSQPFLSPANGLDGVTVAVVPPLSSNGELLPQPTGGATLSIRYAPEADDRFPEPAFHDWPASDQWLGELTGDQSIGQSFYSRYPNLNGITLRVATFGADTGTGPAPLKSGQSVDLLAFPVDGRQIGTIAGGSTVNVLGSAEGWAHVKTADGQDGFIPLDRFATLPPASRKNTHDVKLTLYEDSSQQPLRQVSINAASMHDNSHVTFPFDPIADSEGKSYRFVVTSPDSTPGNAVTFRSSPNSTYADGSRYENGQLAAGALVFKPTFAESNPIYQVNIDDLDWSSLINAFEGTFRGMPNTADRYLSIDVTPGSRTLVVNWTLARPSGGIPVSVDGNSQSPGGGLVFNVRYRDDVSVSGLVSASAKSVWHAARNDPPFFGFYVFVIVGMLTWGGWFGSARWRRGR
jgi:hypothetical protein